MDLPEYHNTAKAHQEFKGIIDQLKAQRISRDDISDRLAENGKRIDKSTITRFYNDPLEGKTHNLKLLYRYTNWIKEAYPKELGLETEEAKGEYDHLEELMNKSLREQTATKRLMRAMLIHQKRNRRR
ncbi:MAG TPA: hypothetical protein VG605_00275 [Puia sp.]|nr:hypothetical protein [Puia sp.]